MAEGGADESMMTENTIIEGESGVFHSIPTSNRFDSIGVGQSEDLGRDESEEWRTVKRKRKRKNTGSVDIEQFETLSKPEQLSAIFSKLLVIERSQHALHGLEPRVHSNTERVRVAETYIDTNSRRIKMLAYKQIDIESKLKQCNLIFRGFRDERGENMYGAVDEILRDQLGLDPTKIDVANAYRLGSFSRARETARRFNDVPRRPILVCFRHQYDVETVLARANKLRGSRYSIDRDYPVEVASARRRIWPDFKRIRGENPNANVQLKFPARVEVNGKTVLNLFPDWNVLMNERASCSYTHEEPRPPPCDESRRDTRPQTCHTAAYDADTESDTVKTMSDDSQHNSVYVTSKEHNIPSSQQSARTKSRVVRRSRSGISQAQNAFSSDSGDLSHSQSLLNPRVKNTQNTNTDTKHCANPKTSGCSNPLHTNTREPIDKKAASMGKPESATNQRQGDRSDVTNNHVDTGQSTLVHSETL